MYVSPPAPGLAMRDDTLLYETSPQPVSSDISKMKLGDAILIGIL